MAKTLRDVADEIHAIGKVLDSGCHPLTLEQEREFGRQLKQLVPYLHAFAREGPPDPPLALKTFTKALAHQQNLGSRPKRAHVSPAFLADLRAAIVACGDHVRSPVAKTEQPDGYAGQLFGVDLFERDQSLPFQFV
jgi:hypothetical protein